MNIGKSDIVGKIRKAIDDIVPSGITDNFTADTDNELWQAVFHAVQSLLETLPVDMMFPKPEASYYNTTHTEKHIKNTDGSGYLILENDFVRFVSLSLTSWNGGIVSELTEMGSDEALRQKSTWGRGSATKPRVMLDTSPIGEQILRYWTAGKTNGSYDHEIAAFSYIPKATQDASTISCVLKDITEKNIIYQAAAIFFEGKKELETAEKFRNI